MTGVQTCALPIFAFASTPIAFGKEHVEELRSVGLDDAEIVDVINSAAFFNWANRLMLSLGEPTKGGSGA